MSGAFAMAGAREAVLRAFDATDWRELPPILWVQPPSPEQMGDFADRAGLAINYVWLTAALYGHDVAFAREVIEAVPQGSDTSVVPHRWLMLVAESIIAEAADAHVAAAGARLLTLHERADAGDTPPSSEWRAARNEFRKIDGELAQAAGNALAAAAWDPVAIPAAISDVPLAWRDYVHRAVEVEIGWDDQKAGQLNQWRSSIRRHAEAAAGPRGEADDWFDTPDGHAWRERYVEQMNQFELANPSPVPDRDVLAREAWTRQLKSAQAIFLSATRQLAPAS